mmetsp:Transcript_73954/g.124544  ORF Transcript_73954/g.124544 Transcript_73954/m.124544 type:complete len:119 (+) Transcript_73954:220-576(+)
MPCKARVQKGNPPTICVPPVVTEMVSSVPGDHLTVSVQEQFVPEDVSLLPAASKESLAGNWLSSFMNMTSQAANPECMCITNGQHPKKSFADCLVQPQCDPCFKYGANICFPDFLQYN